MSRIENLIRLSIPIPRRIQAKTWYKKHIALLSKMERRLDVLNETGLHHPVELLRIAFDCQRINAALFRDAGLRIITGTPIIRNSRVGIVFCAASLESAISIALALLCMRCKPRIQRGLLMESISRYRYKDTTRALRMFFPDLNFFDKSEYHQLFLYRNKILHAIPEYYEDYVAQFSDKEASHLITKWSKSLQLSATEDTEWVRELPKYLQMALQVFETINRKLQASPKSTLPKMRKDHPILEFRKYEAEQKRRRLFGHSAGSRPK